MKKQIPVKKNDYIEVVFEDLTHDGAGVAKVDGILFLLRMLYLVKRQILSSRKQIMATGLVV